MVAASKHLVRLWILALILVSATQAFTVHYPSGPIHTRAAKNRNQHLLRGTGASSHNNNESREEPSLLLQHDKNNNSPVRSVNYFISRVCNYSCQFCFHTQTNSNKLTLEESKRGLHLLYMAGTEKVNFAGGEPFLHPHLLGELCRYCVTELDMAVSIISNGSLITPEWMHEYGEFVDVLGVSVDSFVPEINAAIGRGDGPDAKKDFNEHISRMLRVRELCQQHSINFKLNTVVGNFNWWEDMNHQIAMLEPMRWKVFQVLVLRNENSGGPGELRDARPLEVSNEHYWSFIERHSTHHADILIPEPNNVMQNSYLLLDEELRFLDCSGGGKVPSESILQVGVERALQQSGFDLEMFQQRGGVYNWNRERQRKSATSTT